MRALCLVPDQSLESVLHRKLLPSQRGSAPPCWHPSRFALGCLVALGLVAGVSAETWRGLTIAPEHRCAPYDNKRDYPYPQSVERDIVRELGAVYGPYTRHLLCIDQGDRHRAHRRGERGARFGLCAQDAETRARFARDLLNLTLALRA